MIGFPINKFYTAVAISSNAKLSASIDLYASVLAAVQSPAAIDGTQMNFQGSTDGTTFCDVVVPSSGTAYAVTIGTTKITPVDQSYFKGLRYIKLNCATTQTGARVFGVISTMP